MDIQNKIVNKIADSNLIQLDLAQYYDPSERILYDLKNNLFQGLILKEKDFRDFLDTHNWKQYTDKNVAITCSADAIVPTWAYMLLASKLALVANQVIVGSLEMLENTLFDHAIEKMNIEEYRDKRITIKGCGGTHIPISAYVQITVKLMEVAKSVMYGEACSTVPIYKRKN